MIDNPNSVQQMKRWLKDNGLETDTLGKKNIMELLKTAPEPLKTVLELRQQLAKSSVRKYEAIDRCVCADHRTRGMFQFYGASRTGRYSGRGIQLQNLYRNTMPDLNHARALVRQGDYATVRALYDSVPDVLSQLIRTAFIPAPGYMFYVADFSAIEARVIAWLAGERWRMELFANGGDIYCQSAAQMFKVPVEKHGVNSHLRQKGKIAELACIAKGQRVLTVDGLKPIETITEKDYIWDGTAWVRSAGAVYRGKRLCIAFRGLVATHEHLVVDKGQWREFGQIAASDAIVAGELPVYDIIDCGPRQRYYVSGHLVHNCGYGGSVGALTAMGALEMGLTQNELKPLVTAWRDANPKIVKLWWDVDAAAKQAVRKETTTHTHGLTFSYRRERLFVRLPSGRALCYAQPMLGEGLSYMGVGTNKQWQRIETYGPKIVENLTQAIARDILCYALETLRSFRIVAHVHDEIILEADPAMKLEDLCEQMSRTPPWAEGLILNADGYVSEFYKKE